MVSDYPAHRPVTPTALDRRASTATSGGYAAAIHAIGGSVAPGFDGVRREFERNFAERRELGAACAAYVGGEKVVDLWGGLRDARDGSPWQEHTLVLVYSTSKGLSAMTHALAHS